MIVYLNKNKNMLYMTYMVYMMYLNMYMCILIGINMYSIYHIMMYLHYRSMYVTMYIWGCLDA